MSKLRVMNGEAMRDHLKLVDEARWRRCADEMPDSDQTVMIHHAEEDEPVWLGYHDGETWRLVDGTRCAVSHWKHLPPPPVS